MRLGPGFDSIWRVRFGPLRGQVGAKERAIGRPVASYGVRDAFFDMSRLEIAWTQCFAALAHSFGHPLFRRLTCFAPHRPRSSHCLHLDSSLAVPTIPRPQAQPRWAVFPKTRARVVPLRLAQG